MKDPALKRWTLRVLGLLVLLYAGGTPAQANATPTRPAGSIEDSVCRLIETSAQTWNLPAEFLTRLIWQESSFRPTVVSPAGAEGVAQFMPRTAGERGLANPFDPEQAIPKAAALLGDLRQNFGNLGLAAAAYNAGSARVANWQAGSGDLPAETRNYVLLITGHSVDDWTDPIASAKMNDAATSSKMSCAETVALVRRTRPAEITTSTIFAPWGVQIAGSFSRAAALAAYARARRRYPALLGTVEPMILSGRMLGLGASVFYAIRAPAPSRAAANALCARIMRAGGACAVLRS